MASERRAASTPQQALASFAARAKDGSALAKLPALGVVLTPIVERQIADAERSFRER
jgi:hypothetical protein